MELILFRRSIVLECLHVRGYTVSGRRSVSCGRPKSAMRGRSGIGKDSLYVPGLVGSACVLRPLSEIRKMLAIMTSANQVLVKLPHSMMRWHKWVVLIAGSPGSALRAGRPPNLHIRPGIRRDLVTAQALRFVCTARAWPSWPRPSESRWQGDGVKTYATMNVARHIRVSNYRSNEPKNGPSPHKNITCDT